MAAIALFVPSVKAAELTASTDAELIKHLVQLLVETQSN